jgi:hypothetical protein
MKRSRGTPGRTNKEGGKQMNAETENESGPNVGARVVMAKTLSKLCFYGSSNLSTPQLIDRWVRHEG